MATIRPNRRPEGRLAVVTGAASGIGRAIALELAADGHAVAVLDRSLEGAERSVRAIESAGGRALAAACDVTDEAMIIAAFAIARERFGSLHVLVNGAGTASPPGLPFTNNTADDWDRTLSVNLRGAALTAKAAATDMIAAGDGRIVNISSIVGVINAPFMPPYTVSKAALNSLTRVLAKDFAPYGVTVNAVCPGFVWTPMWDEVGARMVTASEGKQGATPRQVFDQRISTLVPMRREQMPEDVAALVTFLCGPRAGNITGQIISVDGGVTA